MEVNEFIDPIPETQVVEQPTSFRNSKYLSQEMNKLLSRHEPDEKIPPGLTDVGYIATNVFPEWILNDPVWKNPPKQVDNTNEISEIMKVPVSKRSQEQTSTLIHWLMSVWGIANSMGFKRCGAMFREFKYEVYETGENIITEGERGLTFYIIIAGTTSVHKEGIGIVGQLGKGKSFGEIALTQGKDLRTATVTASSKVEVLSLHKNDYDYFVRDLQELEKRENFTILSNCALFKSWPKGKIDKACNTCLRKTFEPGQYIFRQGDEPDDIYVVVEGSVSIFKELVILCKNRWPVGHHLWQERVRKVTKPVKLTCLQRGDFFGEMAILKNQRRSTAAMAIARCVLITLDKLEFLHLINYGPGGVSLNGTNGVWLEDDELQDRLRKYVGDEAVIEVVHQIKGGPLSAAIVGDLKLDKHDLEKRLNQHVTEENNHNNAMNTNPTPRTPNHDTLRPSSRSGAHNKHNNRKKHSSPSPPRPSLSRSQSQSHTNTAMLASNSDSRPPSRGQAMSRSTQETMELITSMTGPRKRIELARRSSTLSFSAPVSTTSFSKLNDFDPSPNYLDNNNDSNGLAVSMSSPLFSPSGKRLSLQGIDNDNSYIFDPRKLVLRRNSVVNMSRIVEQQKLLVQHFPGLQMASNNTSNAKNPLVTASGTPIASAIAPGATANATTLLRRQSVLGSPNAAAGGGGITRRTSTLPPSALLMTAIPEDSSSTHSNSTARPAPVPSPALTTSRRISTAPNANNNSSPSISLLNKAKLSYRDIMEG